MIAGGDDNNFIYIRNSKRNIDNLLFRSHYKKAFALLILVLERLDSSQKIEFVEYYSEQISKNKAHFF